MIVSGYRHTLIAYISISQMTGKGCTPAVYWLNAFVLDAATD